MAGDASVSRAAPVVALRAVGKVFDTGTVALRNLDLDVREREFVSILGPSGCGKSTALRIVAGLIAPTSGTVTWQTPARDGRRGPDRELGFVFQDPTLMPWATVADNVFLPLKIAGASRDAAAGDVARALESVGLADVAKAYPRELSGGMKMRVSIARALVTKPKLLLMDEPFAALDEITRFRLNNDLLAVWQAMRGTVVFVTHSVFESVFLSNRVMVMTRRPGRIFAEIEIDAPYPRDESFRTSPEYAAHCRRVSDILQQAMNANRVA